MSEPKLILPLLANHIMGDPITDRHGIRCCPAILKDTDQKYIVKIISFPANARQMDALLLSGAYSDRESALRYFQELADETVSEAKLLKKLSGLEGFWSYESWQLEPMEDGTGYDVYLLGNYVMTLERYLRKNSMTHLSAVNLGLDLCAALSLSRRNGYLYVDLRPENIVLSDSRGFLIGDLGFVKMSSLKYASLPDKYRSAYTAPEITDAYSSLNTTLDIYAAGMVLYQAYNGGILPEGAEELPAPAYADNEMSAIILKACAADPADRWQDPQEMGQALVGYLQRNTVNDTPIVPIPVEEPAPQEPAEETPAEEPIVEEPIEEVPAEEPIVEEPIEETPVEESIVEEPIEETPAEEPIVEEPATEEPVPAVSIEDILAEEFPAEEPTGEPPTEEPAEETPAEEQPAEETSGDPDQISIEGFLFDAAIPDDLPEGDVTDEVSEMLAQADDLIAHELPGPVVAPEAIEVPMPEPILPEPEPEPEPEPDPEPDPAPAEPVPEEIRIPAPTPVIHTKKSRKKLGVLIGVLSLLLALLLAGLGGYHYYNTEYLQHIESVTVTTDEDWLTVTLDTGIDNTLLTVYCTDTYGNRLTQSVTDNTATFTSLSSGTTYRISVVISGNHKLTGETTGSITTAARTEIINYSIIAGDTDGSVILNFSVQGPDSELWYVYYSTEGEEEKSVQCSHMANIRGLTPGKTYSFRLVPQDDLYLVGDTSMDFTATNVIYAQNLTIHGFDGGALIADWSAPEGVSVSSWTVRCSSSSSGYVGTFVVSEPSIAIEGLDISQDYTVEVKAEGMIVGKSTSITANSVTFKDILVDHSNPDELLLTWNYEGTVPEGGWILSYTVDGGTPIQVVCEKNTCTVGSLIPGATYDFSFIMPEDVTVYPVTAQYTVPAAQAFSGYTVSAQNFIVKMCITPDKADWTWKDVKNSAYTTDFTAGQNAAFVLRLNAEYVTSPDVITTMFVIRDENGCPVSVQYSSETWTRMWYKGYCELELPELPAAPGSYTVEIYLNGMYIMDAPMAFTVT